MTTAMRLPLIMDVWRIFGAENISALVYLMEAPGSRSEVEGLGSGSEVKSFLSTEHPRPKTEDPPRRLTSCCQESSPRSRPPHRLPQLAFVLLAADIVRVHGQAWR